MSKPALVETVTFEQYLVDIAPDNTYDETTNRLLNKIMNTIAHLEEAYVTLVKHYNEGIRAGVDTVPDRVDFETSLRRIRKYVKNMHTFARRKIRVYTEV